MGGLSRPVFMYLCASDVPHMAVFFHFHDRQPALKRRRNLARFIQEIFLAYGKKSDRLEYVFCSDEYLLDINRNFLSHDTYTDIVTFDMSADDTAVSGEIYISVDRVKENAKQFGTDFVEELHRVIFHGILHLCGLGDKTPAEKKRMRQKENELLTRYLVP